MTFDAKTYQLSVYWTRKAVGLKMPKALLQGKLTSKRSKKAKGKSNWAQVQYFSCKTSCVYSNLLLAYEFVSRCWIIYVFDMVCNYKLNGKPVGCKTSTDTTYTTLVYIYIYMHMGFRFSLESHVSARFFHANHGCVSQMTCPLVRFQKRDFNEEKGHLILSYSHIYIYRIYI